MSHFYFKWPLWSNVVLQLQVLLLLFGSLLSCSNPMIFLKSRLLLRFSVICIQIITRLFLLLLFLFKIFLGLKFLIWWFHFHRRRGKPLWLSASLWYLCFKWSLFICGFEILISYTPWFYFPQKQYLPFCTLYSLSPWMVCIVCNSADHFFLLLFD